MKSKFERLWRLSHLVPSFLYIWMQILHLGLGLPHDHTVDVLIGEVGVPHVGLETFELLKVGGH